jgi:FkbM family methyltransferase
MAHTRLQLAHWIAELFDSRLPYFKGARQLRNVLTSMMAPAIRPPQTISTRYGFDMIVTTDYDTIDYQLYAHGIYEAGTLNIISQCLNEGDIFIDVGANIGLMTLLGARRVGPSGGVYAFEPAPATFGLLQDNISLNQMKNIHAMNVGLGSAQGVEVIYSNRQNNRGMISFVEKEPGAAEVDEVPVQTLDEFWEEKSNGPVKMIKIDVEGWELEVLKGAQALLSHTEAPILCVEYNKQLSGDKVVYDFITSINTYEVYILPHGNWHASRLIRVQSLAELPAKGSFNFYCFLPVHWQSIPANLFGRT